MQIERFEKKKSILRYLGKDGKDVRALERLIKQGKVQFDGAYYTVGGIEEKKSDGLSDVENFLLQKENKTSKVDNDRYKQLEEELEVAKVNAKYYEKGMYEVRDLYDKMIEEIFNKCFIKGEIREQVREEIRSRIGVLDYFQRF